jgi:hypothetical protein
MGLLDDAIREHLELKRRRGTDPTEIERMERDALGPIVRGEETPPSFGDEQAYAEQPPQALAEPIQAVEEHIPVAEPAPEPVAQVEVPPTHVEEEDLDGATQEYDVETAAALLADEDVATPPTEQQLLTTEAPAVAASPPPSPAPEPVVEPAQPEPAAPEPELAAAAPPPPAAEPPAEAPAASEQEDASEEDVLEQTPDFLQETPEHDRLWFEQGPPQEFDFDK